ncbi:tetratricopeptide repeat protein [Methylorubrum salsuginis]|uniref:protein O-GlcNAc transferase n=1 Tax=Methylorubrum salsuginis TaxID=414703 RepID=A0A1I4DM05_9HYPH|nr:tetratricopeptide repeat protein [Methylorubrum salsuginis]SFK94113.1 Predicted O-linked N-acetylglucosamine transferase, SPINDLY family [Methylorubrum salsuginis]
MARKGRSGAAAPVEKLLGSGHAHLEAGRFRQAERDFSQALAAGPDNAAARFGLGVAVGQRGGPAQAIPHLVEALRAAPDQAAHWAGLITTLITADRLAEARTLLQRFQSWGFEAATLRSLTAPIAAGLLAEAGILMGRGRLDAAEQRFDLVIALDDANAVAVHGAGVIARQRQLHERALILFDLAARLDGDNPGYVADLADAHLRAGRKAEALALFERVVALDPGHGPAHSALADLNVARGHYGAALRANAAASRLTGLPHACNNRSVLLLRLGRPAEALALLEEALAADPADAVAHSNLVHTALYAAPSDAGRHAVAYGRRHADPLRRTTPHPNDPTPDRPLRIGLVSGDLCDHPVARFVAPFLRHHDQTRLAVFAYANGAADATTERLKAWTAGWRDIGGLDDAHAARLIEADGIDVLLDLSGHSAGHRLGVFARRPAPVQATWIGLPVTTGLSAIDYRLTDSGYDPEDAPADPFHPERLWRLPGTAYCYAPDPTAPEPAPPPCRATGHVTFGCLNRPEKLSAATLAAWARILKEVPGARLLAVVPDVDDPQTRADFEERFRAAGIAPARLDLTPYSLSDRFAAYARTDIALDPFPFNGGTTSYDTLHMGVPLVALRGKRTLGRMGAAVLDGAGLSEWVADDIDGYVARAVRLAADPAALADWRGSLRERLRASPHRDEARHAREVGEALAAMWARWCESVR